MSIDYCGSSSYAVIRTLFHKLLNTFVEKLDGLAQIRQRTNISATKSAAVHMQEPALSIECRSDLVANEALHFDQPLSRC